MQTSYNEQTNTLTISEAKSGLKIITKQFGTKMDTSTGEPEIIEKEFSL